MGWSVRVGWSEGRVGVRGGVECEGWGGVREGRVGVRGGVEYEGGVKREGWGGA